MAQGKYVGTTPKTKSIILYDEDRDNLDKIREKIEVKQDKQFSEIVRKLIKNEANR